NGSFAQASIVYPMVIRLDSQDNIILGEEFLGTIRRINVSSQAIELVTIAPATSRWIWLDVDRESTFGPRDDIFFVSSVGGSPDNEQVYRIAADGSRTDRLFTGSYNFEGRNNMTRAPHYPWMVAVGKGALWTNGFGTDGMIRVRKALPGDRVDRFDEDIYPHHGPGEWIYRSGTVPGFPWGVRPSFALLHGFYGWNQLGTSPNFDDLASLSDAELTTLIQSGWGGQVPRPEITGKDLRDLIFFIRRNSLPSSRAGVRPGPDPADGISPQIQNVTITEVSGNNARVSWQTTEATLGVVQFGASSTNYNRWSDIESSHTTTHSTIIGPLVPGKVYHYSVRVRDLAGNQATAPNATVSIQGGLPADTTPPSTPTNLQASVVSSSQINLSWAASTDNVGVVGYKIYRGGTQIATSQTTSYLNTGLSPSTTYSYTVAAYDAAGNTSAQSASVSAITPAGTSDTTPPSIPQNLIATAVSSSQINLSWNASTDNVGVAGY
ncbi:MAG: fibronectin type III domain-containing protein, partial [Nitrospira sp.]|nr:fibronectin type III domain-containing protein [Nitrospira sp.]